DTNVLVYLFEEDDLLKREKAEWLLQNKPSISFQSVSEFINISRRLLKYPKAEILEDCLQVTALTDVIAFSTLILNEAKSLIIRYDFQIFDAIIVASALEVGCEVLYSEDFQHNLLVENQLRILNPFV
ncbi:MAG: PIN domain-containing protein, partial [Spirosomaceae bacterium]|nr:PIN domain-containing protein [Spirosomataceae bacterium]